MADPGPQDIQDDILRNPIQLIMQRFQCSEEEATARLQASLQAMMNDQEPPPDPPAPPAPFIPPAPQQEDEVRQTIKKKATYVPFHPDAKIPSRLPMNPSDYAIGKMEDIDYVELWYFTIEGCQEAGKAVPTVADNAFGLTQDGPAVALQPLKASKASSKAVIDECLTWEQIMTARHIIVATANRVGWDQVLTFALAQFYITLESMKAEGFKPQALILYHAAARQLWHDGLKGRGDSFNISNICEKLFSRFELQVSDTNQEDLAKDNRELRRQASFIFPPHVCVTENMAY